MPDLQELTDAQLIADGFAFVNACQTEKAEDIAQLVSGPVAPPEQVHKLEHRINTSLPAHVGGKPKGAADDATDAARHGSRSALTSPHDSPHIPRVASTRRRPRTTT